MSIFDVERGIWDFVSLCIAAIVAKSQLSDASNDLQDLAVCAEFSFLPPRPPPRLNIQTLRKFAEDEPTWLADLRDWF